MVRFSGTNDESSGSHRAAVGQILQYLQALAHHVVARLSFDMCDKAHPAGIALLARIV